MCAHEFYAMNAMNLKEGHLDAHDRLACVHIDGLRTHVRTESLDLTFLDQVLLQLLRPVHALVRLPYAHSAADAPCATTMPAARAVSAERCSRFLVATSSVAPTPRSCVNRFRTGTTERKECVDEARRKASLVHRLPRVTEVESARARKAWQISRQACNSEGHAVMARLN